MERGNWDKQLCVLLMLFLLGIYSDFAQGNDVLIGESGHTVVPLSTDNIRMVSEKVIVRLESFQPTLSWLPGPARRAFVECEFVFENLTKGKIHAKVGFPGNEDHWGYPRDVTLHDFKSSINGVHKKVRIRKELLRDEGISERGEKREIFRQWYVWDVTFPPSKKITVKNSYWVLLSSDQETWWFEYMLVTGANWQGTIDKADIQIIYSSAKELKKRVIAISPLGYQVKHNKIIWTLRNFKPVENIKIVEHFLVEK